MAGEYPLKPQLVELEAQLSVPDTKKKHISLNEMATALEGFQAKICYIIATLRANEKANKKEKKEYSIQIGIDYNLNGIKTKQSSDGTKHSSDGGTNMFEIEIYCGDGGGDGDGGGGGGDGD